MTTNATANRQGYTLIELTIAVALGAMVIYLAVAGVRTAAQGVTAAKRLALENAIIRTGVVIALENTDFWTDHDLPYPDDPAKDQPLRALTSTPSDPAGMTRGLPFTPFLTTQAGTGYRPASGTVPGPPLNVSATVAAGLDETAGGWNPNAWQAAEARGWSWGNLTERTPRWSGASNRNVPVAKYKIFGHYESVASTDPGISTHHWQQRQLDGLQRSLGSYGLFDYLPANTGLMIYQKVLSGADTGKWMTATEWCNPDGGPYFRLASDFNLSFALDRLADTWGTLFQVPNRNVTASEMVRAANRRYSTGIAIGAAANNRSVDDIKQLLIDGDQVDAVLHDSGSSGPANKPEHWPQLTVRNLRFLRTGAFINLNRIAWVNPLTGQGSELTFTCFGTTLRGARQQRLRDEPGWADPFPLAGAPKPNLDSY